jgi:sugar phosphate isomerase/epimerase
MNRRHFISKLGLGATGAWLSRSFVEAADRESFRFRYMLASSMYGRLPLQEILPEVGKIDSGFIDIWPEVHGDQREQMETLGYDAFERLLETHEVRLGCLTHYDLGPFRLAPELPIAKRFHCPVIVCGGSGPAGLSGAELKGAVKEFAELMKPHLELAEANGVSIAIENHGHSLIDSADSLKWLMDLRPSTNLKVALAPYHLEVLDVDEKGLAELISVLGNEIAVFYAWQHGMGCSKKLPKEQELLQMPGRGTFDFGRTVEALKGIQYRGFTEIFMHPVPRGIPILPTAKETTNEINRSRSYLEDLLVAR